MNYKKLFINGSSLAKKPLKTRGIKYVTKEVFDLQNILNKIQAFRKLKEYDDD